MSAGVSTQATTQVTRRVKLSPAARLKAKRELDTIARLLPQAKALKAEIDEAKKRLEKVFEDAGEAEALDQGTTYEGFKLKVVRGIQRNVNWNLLYEMGVTPEMREEATESKPKKPSLKVTPPGADDEED